MNREKVISREYKLVLKEENFSGNESDLKKKAQIFWTNFEKIINPVIKTVRGNLDTIKIKREIRFYDTKDFTLHNKGYIFRERKNLSDDKREVTLKFRHFDRYFSQDRSMKSGKNGKAETKFEEDIKMPFLSLYSFSTSQPIPAKEDLKKMKNIIKLYPGLTGQLNKSPKDENIFVVHDLVIQEIVITGAELNIGNDPLVNAECALIVWYDTEAFRSDPIIVEFSFRYGNKKERYTWEAAQKAYALFKLIQEEMKSWIGGKGATKTGFVYDNK
jgi:hypothetical protein